MPTPEKCISIVSANRARFLNVEDDISAQTIWQDSSKPLLWLYNLHYFDDLSAKYSNARLALQRELVSRWIRDNPPGVGIGWQPYPTSLRIVNWIKWHLKYGSLSEEARNSLAVQARYLSKRLEYHILGNHLLANAKALFFAGAFFGGTEGAAWLETADRLLRREIREQVLADGAHFELSPMYHLIVLEDLLDVFNLATAFAIKLPEGFSDIVSKMLGWSQAMRHGDQEIPLFNDASFGIAHPPQTIDDYAHALGLEPVQPSHHAMIQASGYARLSNGNALVFLDAAKVGPDYLPGHAHADTLSIEFSIGSERVVVNGGTSIYGTGPDRQRQRGTAAHSTIVIDEKNSSDVWAGFRVGRRATVSNVNFSVHANCQEISATHDGYRFLPGRPMHRRALRLEPGQLSIMDSIEGQGKHRIACLFHLHPSIIARQLSRESVELLLPSGTTIVAACDAGWTVNDGMWHPEFSKNVPNTYISVTMDANLPHTLEISFTWEA